MSHPDELRADIVAARAELAETADALAAKLDVKARAGEKLRAVTADKRRVAVVGGGAAVLVALLVLRRVRGSRSPGRSTPQVRPRKRTPARCAA